MSQAVKAALLATKDLGKTERLVVLAIAAHTNSAGDAWPSVATIADYVGVSERTVQRALVRLVEAGRIVWRHVAGIATRVYRLVVAAVEGVSSAAQRVTDQQPGMPIPAAGGDSQSGAVSPEVEEVLKGKGTGSAPRDAAGRLAWWQFKRSTPDSRQRPSYPERRGAALPPANRADQCPAHPGWLAGNCGGCRGEQLAGGVR